MIRIIQVNLGKGRAAWDVLQQRVKELTVDMLILSEQCKQPEFSGWHEDDTMRPNSGHIWKRQH